MVFGGWRFFLGLVGGCPVLGGFPVILGFRDYDFWIQRTLISLGGKFEFIWRILSFEGFMGVLRVLG